MHSYCMSGHGWLQYKITVGLAECAACFLVHLSVCALLAFSLRTFGHSLPLILALA